MNKVFNIGSQKIQVQEMPASHCPGCQELLLNLTLFGEIHAKLLIRARKGVIKPSYDFYEFQISAR